MCEKCNKYPAKETHHLLFQEFANEDDIIKNDGLVFKKNNAANLMSLCNECHDKIHKKKVQHKRVKTTKGYTLQEV